MALPDALAPLIDLTSLNISYFSYSHDNVGDDFMPLVEQLVLAPVWVLATPLYWYTMSAQAKTFLDRLSDLLSFRKSLGHQLKGKTLAVLCAGTDEQPPMSLEQPFELTAKYLGMAYAGAFYAQFEGRALVKSSTELAAREFGQALVDEAATPSVEATAKSRLRLLSSAPHVER